MAMYFVENNNEEVVENTEVVEEQEVIEENDSILDNMLEACDYMMNLLGIEESTAAQRHFNATSKDFRDSDEKLRKQFSKEPVGRLINKVEDAAYSSKSGAKNAAKKVATAYHSGSADRLADESVDGPRSAPASKKESDLAKARAKAEMRGSNGYTLSRYQKSTGVDVKGEYDKAAAKADKKRAVKEACLNILAALDDIEE